MLMSAGATPGVSDSRLGVSDSRPAMLSVAISQERLAVGVRSGGRSGDAPRPGQRRATDLAAGALACRVAQLAAGRRDRPELRVR